MCFSIIFIPLVYFLIDLLSFLLLGQSAGEYLLLEHSSWRHLSNYGAIYGADLFSFPSFGAEWVNKLQSGIQSYSGSEYGWLIWPWNLYSVLLFEFGIIPATILILFLYKRVTSKLKTKNDLFAYSALLICVMLLTPKWCIYYLLYPTGSIKNV
jgi:hypothetical protein